MNCAKSRCRSGYSERSESYSPVSPADADLHPAFEPGAPVVAGRWLGLHLPEPRHEIPRQRFLAETRTLQDARDHRMYLARVHRLHQVLADVHADCLTQRGILFTLGDQNDGEGRTQFPELPVRLEPALARHLLVQQHDVERVATKHLNRVVRVPGPFYLVTLLVKEEAVRFELFGFVVHPEHCARTRWHGRRHGVRKLSVVNEVGNNTAG